MKERMLYPTELRTGMVLADFPDLEYLTKIVVYPVLTPGLFIPDVDGEVLVYVGDEKTGVVKHSFYPFGQKIQVFVPDHLLEPKPLKWRNR